MGSRTRRRPRSASRRRRRRSARPPAAPTNASSNVRAPSGPGSISTGSRSPVGSMRSSRSRRSRTGISTCQSERSTPGSWKYGWYPNEIGTGTSPVASTVVAIVRARPARVTSIAISCGNGKARRRPSCAAKSNRAASVPPSSAASRPVTSQPGAAERSPWIGSPLGSVAAGGSAASTSTSAPMTSNRHAPSRFAQGWSRGTPIVERSATYRASPPRCPSNSVPLYVSEQPTIPAPGTNAASIPSSGAESVTAWSPSMARSPIIRGSGLRPLHSGAAARPRRCCAG